MDTATKDHFSALIISSANDPEALAALDKQLQARTEPWAGPLRYRVIGMRRKLTAVAAPPGWAKAFGLPAPDGRPLHQYRLPGERFHEIAAHLKQRANRRGFAHPPDEALFVLWAAEWFRRHFAGGQLRWDDVGRELGLALDDQDGWRGMADRGLRLWGVPPLRLNGIHYRLLHLARQGGFPVAALEAGGGWAGDYLKRLVGILLSEPAPSPEIAFGHAAKLESKLPKNWQSRDFLAVSADLALAVVKLRRRAERGEADSRLPPSAWLSLHEPSWRDSLPLVIDSTAGQRLIDGLMTAEAVRGGTGDVRVARVFEKTQDGWRPTLAFELNGRIRLPGVSARDSGWNRLRLFAGAELARHIPGELAVAEPDAGETWFTSASNAGRRTPPVPLDTPVTVELRGGGERVGEPVLLPGGKPVTGPLRVCFPEGEGDGEAPRRLVLTGTGGGRFRADPLYVFAPGNWTLEPGENGTVEALERRGGQHLWRVRGSAVATSPEGDHYRLVAGQGDDERDALILHGKPPDKCRGQDPEAGLHHGRPEFFVQDRGGQRAARPGEVWWRRPGERGWRSIAGLSQLGRCEFAWRDPAGFVRDRQVAIILPPEFRTTVRKTGEHVVIEAGGWPGPMHVQPGTPDGPGRWTVPAFGRTETVATVSLGAPGALPVMMQVRLPHQALIAEWSGTPLPKGARVALTGLHQVVARADGACELQAQLVTGDRRRIPGAAMQWVFRDELPLNGIRDELAALLRPLGDLDATVELQFSDSGTAVWHVCEFGVTLDQPEGGLLQAPPECEGALIEGRALHAPLERHTLGHAPAPLPPLPGSWLAYLRRGERVLSRPLLLPGPPSGEAAGCRIGQAMALPDWTARNRALDALCAEAEGEGPNAQALVRTIVGLATGLEGLPPSTFDVLRHVAKRPQLAARLLFEATEAELDAVMALAAGLPFAWPLVPWACWNRAAELHFRGLDAALPPDFPGREALCAGAVTTRRKQIAEREPALAVLLDQAVPAATIDGIVQAFMHRAHDRAASGARNPFRPGLASLLPDWARFDPSYWRVLDAPCAAARHAAGHAWLDEPQLRCVKDVARRHPRYFEQAFAAAWKEAARG